MAPSRGANKSISRNSSTTTAEVPPNDSDAANLARESSALARARINFKYLIDPSTSERRPNSLRARLLLRSLHSLGVFIFWRALRWAKYALVGSIVAAVGSLAAFGSFASGVGFLAAPPGILASVAMGTLWGLGKWGWRRMYRKSQKKKASQGAVAPREETYVKEPPLQAVPW